MKTLTSGLSLIFFFLLATAIGAQPSQQFCTGDKEDLSRIVRTSLIRTEDIGTAEFAFELRKEADVPLAVSRWLSVSTKKNAVVILANDGGFHCAILIDRTGMRAASRSKDGYEQIALLHDQWRMEGQIDRVHRGARAGTSKKVSADTSNLPSRGSRPEGRYLFPSEKEVLAKLYDSVFPDAVGKLLPTYEEIYVLPYAELGTIPFSALYYSSGSEQVIDRAFVSVLPSADILFARSQQMLSQQTKILRCRAQQVEMKSHGSLLPLVIGNPKPPANSEWSFPSLPGAEREAHFIAGLLGARLLVGKEANRSTFLDSLSTANEIHIAAHGIALPNGRWGSIGGSLMLSDGPIGDDEISRRCFPADLVVLSACQTGLGRTAMGGVVGMARAFQKAGADEVVMSLWSVGDANTEVLMEDFWSNWSRDRNASAASALRLAMLKMRKEHPQTYDWAGFTVFGVKELQ